MSGTIGIDPGVSGGITLLLWGQTPRCFKMPETERDVFELLKKIKALGGRHAALEFIRSQPAMGVKSIFTFGRGYGGLRMALIALDIPFEEVVPRRWQADMRCLSKGNKNVTKSKAQDLEPRVKMTHAIADSFLIAAWCEGFSKVWKPGRRKPKVKLL